MKDKIEKLRNRHITRFGSPLFKHGAQYLVNDREGLIRMDIDIKLAESYTKGISITPKIKSQIKDEVYSMKAEFDNKVKNIGVPDKFKTLFNLTKKSQVERFLHDIVISEYELFL